MKVRAPHRRLVSYFDPELEIWQDRPEQVGEWIRRTIHALREGLFSKSSYQPDDFEIAVRSDIYRELLREIPPIPSGASQLFGATLRLDPGLTTWFEISWTSQEERALQSLLDSWR